MSTNPVPYPKDTPVCWVSSGQWHTGTVSRQRENGCFTLWSEEEQLMSLNVQPESIQLREVRNG